MRIITFLISLTFLANCSYANNYYDFKITRVLDGDTVEFEAKFLIPELGNKLKLRILGVDTPEKGRRANCDKEEKMSLNAKLFVEQEISNGKKIQISIKKWDKYGGRVLGDVILDGKRLSEQLIANGHARPYKGDKKTSWCE